MSDEGKYFLAYIARERARLDKGRSQITDNIAYLQGLLANIDREFAAINAYEAAKTGKPAKTNGAAPRAWRGSRREAILQAVAAKPDGMSRGELIEHVGVKGDKSGEMSVSNALTALTQTGQLVREGGRYYTRATDSNLRAAAE